MYLAHQKMIGGTLRYVKSASQTNQREKNLMFYLTFVSQFTAAQLCLYVTGLLTESRFKIIRETWVRRTWPRERDRIAERNFRRALSRHSTPLLYLGARTYAECGVELTHVA